MPQLLQHTVRRVPRPLNARLREYAKDHGISLNEALLRILQKGLGEEGALPKHRSLGWMAGTWVEDPAFDEALVAQRKVDPEDWR